MSLESGLVEENQNSRRKHANSTEEGPKPLHLVNNNMSLIDSNSNNCSFIGFMTRDVNQSMEGEQGCKSHLDPNEEEQYHLPRSSPVISRKKKGSHPVSLSSRKKSGLYSVVSNTFIELPERHLLNTERSSQLSNSNKLQTSFPEREWMASSAQISSQHVHLDSHCALVENMSEKSCNEQENLSHGSSESQSSLTEEFEFIDISTKELEKEPTTCLDTCLILGPENEKEKMKEELYRNSVDIDQENAHFVVVDMVLEVLEVAKWNVSQKYTDDSSFKYRDQKLCLKSSSDTSVQRCSAEVLAQKFMLKLGKWVIPTEELLEELPLATISMGTGCEASLTDKILQRSRTRGAFIWTPPQFQIIYSIHPTQRRSEVLASQNFLCAGCGTEVEPRYMKRLSYCNYLGKYFCDCCHVGSESIIPSRVLNNWDFGRYSVCQFSHQLLVSIWEKPLFTITSVAKNLYCQAKELQKFREIQEQLISIKKLLKACRLSDGVLAEFQQLSSHLSQELHLFSMDDLIRIKRGQYLATAKAVMKSATAHVDACELCQAKGFICEFCHGPDVIFPFQTDVCSRCQDCRTCFHTSCFQNEPCPKCVRVQSRKILKET